ncbi:MAG: VWA domain-containing protein [Pyrinomonadaceae bacterium]
MNPRSSISYLVLFVCFAGTAIAQSGRVKPGEAPVPSPTPKRSIYVPTILPLPSTSPTPKKDDDEVIKVDSALVPIPVSVLDSNGRAITNLKLTDFELRIDGRPAEIGDLARSETPIRLAMLFDNSSSVRVAREFEKDAAVRFFRQVVRPDKDLASLFSVSTTTRMEQGLTRDVSLLVNAIEMFPQPEGATALLDGLTLAAEYLGGVQGRRVIVIVSDGDDTISDLSFEQMLKAIQIANCQVYVVKTTDFENYKRTGVRGGNANLRQLAAERRMIELTRQTGGNVYSPIDEDELDRAFRQISAELSQQYILSYYPDDELEKRGEFREIGITVKTKPAAAVRTRKGYYVPKK